MDEKDRAALVLALEGVTEELHHLRMAQTVQRTALALLARHLAAQGHVQLEALARDMETMGATQPEPGWQEGFAEIAGALRLVRGQP